MSFAKFIILTGRELSSIFYVSQASLEFGVLLPLHPER